jgi:MFS family permease
MSPRLSGKTRLFLAGNFLSMLGTGLVLPFMIIYLHQARGIALAVVGALLAAGAAVGVLVAIVCGALMDRVGARPVLGTILLGQVVAEVGLAWAHNTLDSVAGRPDLRGDVGTDVRRHLDDDQRSDSEPALQQRAFAVNFATQNMALGIGAAVAALVIRAIIPGPSRCSSLPTASLVFSSRPCCPRCRTCGEQR